ncbi:MAG: SGNH/GDSL hydrolase family protein, partial [Planctomycetaceae bacterium]
WQLSIPDWKSLPGSSRARFTGETMLHSEQSGSSLAFSFTGRAVGAFVLAGPDAGQLEYRIDDGEWKSVELYHRFSRGLHYPRTVMFESELAAKEHQVEVRVSAEHHADSKGTAARVLSFVVNR